jgi:hypothetical protein
MRSPEQVSDAAEKKKVRWSGWPESACYLSTFPDRRFGSPFHQLHDNNHNMKPICFKSINKKCATRDREAGGFEGNKLRSMI